MCVNARLLFFGALSFEEKSNQLRLIDEIFRFRGRREFDEGAQRAFDDFLDAMIHSVVIVMNECSHRFVAHGRCERFRSSCGGSRCSRLRLRGSALQHLFHFSEGLLNAKEFLADLLRAFVQVRFHLVEKVTRRPEFRAHVVRREEKTRGLR